MATAASASPTSGADAKPSTAVVEPALLRKLRSVAKNRIANAGSAFSETAYAVSGSHPTRWAYQLGSRRKDQPWPREAFGARGNPVVRALSRAPKCCCSMSRCQSHCRQDGQAVRCPKRLTHERCVSRTQQRQKTCQIHDSRPCRCRRVFPKPNHTVTARASALARPLLVEMRQ